MRFRQTGGAHHILTPAGLIAGPRIKPLVHGRAPMGQRAAEKNRTWP